MSDCGLRPDKWGDCAKDAGRELGEFVSDPNEYVGEKIEGAAESVASSAAEGLADALFDGLIAILTSTLSWWVGVDSPEIDDSKGTVADIRGWVFPIAAAVAVGGAIWQGIRMMLMRKAEPLIDIGRGMLLLAVAAAIGATAPTLALQAGDSFSVWVINESTGGDFKEAILESFSNPAKSSGSIGIMLVLGVLAIIAATIQALLMIFREGAVILLSGVIVLAAAGSFTGATSGWLRKVTAWMAALVFFKPVAALVYAATFSLLGNSDDIRDMITALGMLIMSIFALPSLMKLFDWSIGSLQSGGGGLAGAAALAGAGAGVGMAKRVSTVASANEHSRFMQQSLGPVSGQSARGGTARGAQSAALPATGTGAAGTKGAVAARAPAAASASAGTGVGAAGAGVTAAGIASGAAAGVAGVAAAGYAVVKGTQKVAEAGSKAIGEK